jgi:hypothetical protein
MGAIASLEDLRAVKADLGVFEHEHPEGATAFAELLKKHRKVGYKNICKMALGSTPEELKE